VRSSQAAANRGYGSKNTTFVGVARFFGADGGGGGDGDGDVLLLPLMPPPPPPPLCRPSLLLLEVASRPLPSPFSVNFPAVRANTPPPSSPPPLLLRTFTADAEEVWFGAWAVELRFLEEGCDCDCPFSPTSGGVTQAPNRLKSS